MRLTPYQLEKIARLVRGRSEPIPEYKRAAVLLLVVNKRGASHIVYTRRTSEVSLHAGQISFPGGKVDPADLDDYATAARETREEIGVEPSQYTHVGRLGYFETFTSRHDAIAHLAFSPRPLTYRVNPAEVVEVIEIPVATLLEQFRPNLNFDDPDEVMYLNFRYRAPETDRVANLWGLTARITHHFFSGLSQLI